MLVVKYAETQIVLGPRDYSGGVDWSGRKRVVLATVEGDKDKQLWWLRPGKNWTGVGMPWEYTPTSLTLWRVPGSYGWQDLREGGKLSKKLIAEFAAKIDEFFGEPVAKFIDPKKTLLIGKRSLVLQAGEPRGRDTKS